MPDFYAAPLSWPEAEAAFVSKGIMTAEEFYALREAYRGYAFTTTLIQEYAVMIRIKRKLEQIIASGETVAAFQEWAAADGIVWAEAYSELVFRMAVQGSYAQARYDEIMDPDIAEEFELLMYSTADDDRVRDSHAEMDGFTATRAEFPDHWWPQNGFNCFSGDVAVAGKVEIAYRNFYSGEMIELKTRGNKNTVTLVTPNHPIATASGWMKAKSLKPGAQLMVRRPHGGCAVRVDDEHTPISMKKLFHLAEQLGLCTPESSFSHDFHGDALFGNGKVDVVRLPRVLSVGNFSKLRESLSDLKLTDTETFGPGLSDTLESRKGRRSSTACNIYANAFHTARNVMADMADLFRDFSDRVTGFIEGLRLCRNLCIASGADDLPTGSGVPGSIKSVSIGKIKNLLFADSSDGNTKLDKPLCDGRSRHVENSGHGSNADAIGFVTLDEVVSVRRVPFSDHVYNLQTVDGVYSANGIISHNCRCTIRALNTDLARRAGAKPGRPIPTDDDGRPVRPDEGFRANQNRDYGRMLDAQLAQAKVQLEG